MIVVPTIHPAGAMRSGKPLTDTIAADIGKAYQISQGRLSILRPDICVVLPQAEHGMHVACAEALARMRAWRAKRCPVGVDIEAGSLDYFRAPIWSLGLAGAGGVQAVSFTLLDFKTLPPEMEYALVSEAHGILADPHIEKVFQNGPFDRAMLIHKGFTIKGRIFDTLSAHHAIQPDIPHGLDWIGQTYLPVRAWKRDHKGEKMLHTEDPWELLHYNGEDALYTVLCRDPEIADICERSSTPDALMHACSRYADLATRMELAGIPINREVRREIAIEMLWSLYVQERQMREYLGWKDFNPMSQAHRMEALFGQKYAPPPWNLGIRQMLRTPTGLPRTGYKSIIDFLEHPFVRKLVSYIETRQIYAAQYREGADVELWKLKQVGLYDTIRHWDLGLPQEVDMEDEVAEFTAHPVDDPGSYERAICEDGRLHAQVRPAKQMGTRFTFAPNMQNQRLKDRRFIEAPPGRVLIASDKDQLELRLVAVRAGVRELLTEMQQKGGDPHRLAARNIYGQEFEARSPGEQKKLRNMVKNVVYAGIYMATTLTIWRTLRERKMLSAEMRAALTLPRVSHICRSYFGRYPEIKQYHLSKMDFIKDHGYLSTLHGISKLSTTMIDRRRYFPFYPPPFNEVANYDTQTLGAEIVTEEMCDVQDELDERFPGTAFLILHGHDQLVAEAREQDAEAVAEVVDRRFGNTYVEGPHGHVYLTATAKIGKTLNAVK